MTHQATLETQFSIATHNGTIIPTCRTTGRGRIFRIRTRDQNAELAPGQRVAQVQLFNGEYETFAIVTTQGRVDLLPKFTRNTFYLWAKDFLQTPEDFLATTDVAFTGRPWRLTQPR